MAFSHLEQLISEYLEWQGYLIKRNVKVGRLKHGGWEMELDIIGYHPSENKLVHYEPSIDALSWTKREARYKKKFEAGKKHIKEVIFKWIPQNIELKQYAVFISHPKDRHSIAGGKIISVDELASEISAKVAQKGIMSKNAIQETYPLLRTIQLVLNGYYRTSLPHQIKENNISEKNMRALGSEKTRKWHLNVRQGWYETQVDGDTQSERVLFGVTNWRNKKVELGEVTLNYQELYKDGLIRKKGEIFRVRVYYDCPEFYISAKRPDKKRLPLGFTYKE